jgi:hypothetical protein
VTTGDVVEFRFQAIRADFRPSNTTKSSTSPIDANFGDVVSARSTAVAMIEGAELWTRDKRLMAASVDVGVGLFCA